MTGEKRTNHGMGIVKKFVARQRQASSCLINTENNYEFKLGGPHSSCVFNSLAHEHLAHVPLSQVCFERLIVLKQMRSQISSLMTAINFISSA